MALIDERDAFLVRVVYDGPPFSGKTTSLQALASELAGQLETPHEHEGRTLYFDWLEYTAGHFEGTPVRCQVLGVPGQKIFAERRRQILQHADAIVFVADTGAPGVELSVRYAADMMGQRQSMLAPHPGVVVQANKRDVEDAVPLAEVAAHLRGVGLEAALVESVASTGKGVRDAFLFGLRLALDRVKALAGLGMLRRGRPEFDSASELLRHLGGEPRPGRVTPLPAARTQRGPAQIDVALEALETAVAMEQVMAASQPGAAQTDGVALPSPLVPSGCIWPAVEGRVIVQQAVDAPKLALLRPSSEEIYAYSPSGWRLHSRTADVFTDHNAARAALLKWARCHARHEALITGRRAIVASPDGERWRLWQIVGAGGSLAEVLHSELSGTWSPRTADALLMAARALIDATDAFRAATVELPVRLTTVTTESGAPKFIGLMPPADRELGPGARRAVLDAATLVADRMQRVLADCARTLGPQRLIAALTAAGGKDAASESLAGMLIAAVRRAA